MKRLALDVFVGLVGTIGLVGASNAHGENGDMLTAAQDGLWEKRGYSEIIRISEGKHTASWTIGSSFCYQEPGAGGWSLDRLRLEGDHSFSAYEKGGITEYAFDRVVALPDNCIPFDQYQNSNPEVNFDTLWRIFYENYRFFHLYDVDWLNSYLRFRPKVTSNTTDAELWGILTDMIGELRDAHIKLIGATDGDTKYWRAGRDTTYRAALEKQHADNPQMSVEALDEAFEASLQNYVKSSVLKGVLQTAFNEQLIWGKLTDDVGYLYIGSMQLTDDGVAEEIAAVAKVLDDQAIPFLRETASIVVDVRFNGGGYDATSLKIASRLGAQNCLAFTKQTPRWFYHGTPQKVFSGASEDSAPLNQPVVLLTSASTGSASEIFAMAMRVQPNVIIVGETTKGILSDTWGATLPNGWEFSLSNELYIAADGGAYEGIGLPPDVDVAVFKGPNIIENLSTSLDRAVQIAQQATMPDNTTCRHTEFD